VESARIKVAGIAFTAVLAALGLAAVIGGLGYGAFGEKGLIGPGFLPVLAGGLVALFAVIDVVGRLRSRAEHDTAAAIVSDAVAPVELEPVEPEAIQLETAEADRDVDIYGRSQKQRTRMLVAVIGILIATLVLVNVVGFIIAFALMLLACAVVVERQKLLPSIIVTVVALSAAYLIFGVMLRVPLPQGLLGIL
jgi:hypothetical protein